MSESGKRCRWCGELHGVRCPWVKAITYRVDGTVKRVEFHDSVPVNLGVNPRDRIVGTPLPGGGTGYDF